MAILRAVTTFLRTLSPEEADAVARGNARITLEGRAPRTPKRHVADRGPEALDLLVESMKRASTREEAAAALESAQLRKADLIAIARSLDVPVASKDRIESIQERLLESTVGYRLRSRAIRGESGASVAEN